MKRDNNLFLLLRPLMSLFPTVEQWGLQTNVTMSGTPIILPLTAKILRGVVSDGGNYNNSCGFDANTGKIYASNTAVAFIVLCR